ncbi:MAG: serine hydrolase [Gemmataceae bacterium]
MNVRIYLVLFAAPALAGAAEKPLADRIDKLDRLHAGKVSVVVQRFGDPVAVSINPDEPMPTASLIKFPIMVEAYEQFAEGKVKPDDMCTLQQSDKVPGSGILTDHFTPGAAFSLRDAVRMMIVWSDNTATNMVLDRVGIRNVNERMEKMGLPNTKVHSKTFKRETSVDMERSKKFGLGSTTSNEMLKLLTLLQEKKLVSEEASKEMMGHMLKCDDHNKFPRFLPPGTKVAMKTGSVDNAKTCAGIISTKAGPVAVVVLTADNKDKGYHADNAGDLFCAKVAKEVFDYYSEKK